MKRTLLLTVALSSTIAAAHAADWTPPKVPDPIPDNLSWNGITVIGALDLGYAYQTNGRPLGSVVSGLEYSPFTTTRNYTGQSISTIAHSGLQQSFLGLKIEEPLGAGWEAIGRADTGVDPLRGTLSDGCSSFIQNAGVVYTAQNSNADSGRCGQVFNGQLWGGVANNQYGTLTIGRQNSLELDNIAKYDPMELSYAFSLLGYSGTNGGMGSTQAARWDNSAKYVYDFNGFVHVGGMYSQGGNDTGFFGDSYGLNIGGAYRGFAIDATYTKEHGAVNLQSSVNDPLNATTLAANISDNSAWSVMAKYTFNLGGGYAPPAPYPTKAAVKALPQQDKLILFAGYTNISQTNPDTPVTFGGAAGGYTLTSTPGVLPDNNAFTTAKVLDFVWVGARYELAWGLSFTGAYYHVNQNAYIADSSPCVAGGASKGDCAGAYDQVSFLTDYALNKHLDVYAGATWARVTDGLASGFPGTPGAKFGFAGTGTSIDTATVMTGLRIKL
ncbi:MAG: porin [Bradyrhizobium sp.]|uniref:porin n=1 Tax=Bradyrhizobium sp. TaxID=376 RepID=UPI001C29C606|nr:porin [Bradyrhizobium sp.]MBU6463274.1 porin [Pseudomonadota bacterium]MDE2066633.1 porin [Bradyrhizobium sp.]MDE2472689.1 porin [Bradyrhizobium sp.]